MNIRHIFTLILLFFTGLSVSAQDGELLTLRLETRLDYMQEHIAGDKIQDNSGFKGKYLNIRIDGNLTDKLSYSYRQRLNKPNGNVSFFEATDWINLTYTTGNWGLSGGKQVVAIGGYEYDRTPIDCYFCSEYWNNIACYQIGTTLSYTSSDKNDKFLLQFCESPFRKNALNTGNKEMFAYNLMWYGTHGIFSSMYSVNMIEYLPGKFINYISAGSRFDVGEFALELDLMNRAVSLDSFFGKNYSVIAELSWKPTDQLNIFAKMSYDRNMSGKTGDFCVADGTSITRVGAGLEYYPIKNMRNLRLHINGCYTYGQTLGSTVLQPGQTIVDGGITWYMNLLNIKRK